ncbi:hypothetical protein J3L16_05480 [Alteromonas sp. 5E99-2]|uniref:hypothetical protein n=1 Tax=Alteromonas sp. 5E99-2 TaxID=2817683 RepID=UPI001A998074|nr:hypothetical protein [Alteromonas sp. 5E99-2]MBO1255138.1 hypothetical protein [Alteromonas sp. 5E99-2]
MATDKKQYTAANQTISQFVDAGIGLAMLPFSLLQRSFTAVKEDSINHFSSLQERGSAVEKQLKENLTSFKLCSPIKSRFDSLSSKDAKLEQLSVKIDSLVELVAELAAKKAAETKSKPTQATPRKRAARSSTTAKPRTTRAKSTTSTTKKDA